jgi:hypothetical protein
VRPLEPTISAASDDTADEARRVQLATYRRLGGAGRTEAMFRLNELARELALAGIRSRHPEYDEEDVRRALVCLKYGPELARAVFPGRDRLDP